MHSLLIIGRSRLIMCRCIASTTLAHAAHKREREKIEKYKELTGFIFVPIGIETSGVWGPNALKFIREVGNKLKTTTGQAASTAYLTQRISLAVQRGNAASIIRAIPQPKGLEEIVYILHPHPTNPSNVCCITLVSRHFID